MLFVGLRMERVSPSVMCSFLGYMWCRTQVLYLDYAAVFQAQAVDSRLLVIGDECAILFCNSQAVDVEACFGGDAVVEIAGAALDVDAGLFRQLGNAFALELGQMRSDSIGNVTVPLGLICRLTGLEAIVIAGIYTGQYAMASRLGCWWFKQAVV